MVRFVAQNGESTIQLLDEKESHHLVVEGHLGKRHFAACVSIDTRSKAKGTANDESKIANAGIHLFLKILRGRTFPAGAAKGQPRAPSPRPAKRLSGP